MCFTAPIHIKPRLFNTKKVDGYKVIFIDHNGHYRAPYIESFKYYPNTPTPFVELVPSFSTDEINSIEFSIYEGYHFFTNLTAAKIEVSEWVSGSRYRIFRIEVPIKTNFYINKIEGIGVASSIVLKEMVE